MEKKDRDYYIKKWLEEKEKKNKDKIIIRKLKEKNEKKKIENQKIILDSKKIIQNKIVIDIYHQKIKQDIIYRILSSLSKRATVSFKKYNITKKYTHLQLIGCSLDELRVYLENKFQENMTWENYGEWELDHIKPVSKYNLENESELLECFNYKNVQPLWMSDNRRKKDKFEEA